MSTQVNIGWVYNNWKNSKYYLYILSSITQMLTKSNPNNFYNIYIITDANDNFDLIKVVYNGTNYKIIKSQPKGLEYIQGYSDIQPRLSKWSNAMYWKHLYAFTFPHLDKIIVCDPDILFSRDIAEFWEKVDVENYHYLAPQNAEVKVLAKPDNSLFYQTNYKSMLMKRPDYENLKEKILNKWINSGFFITNLKKIRDDHCYEDWKKAIEYLVKVPNSLFGDEDMLYLSDKTKIGFIEEKYCLLVFIGCGLHQHNHAIRDVNKLRDIAKNALTYHCMEPKPWNYDDSLNTPGTFQSVVGDISFDYTWYNHEVFKDYKRIYNSIQSWSFWL